MSAGEGDIRNLFKNIASKTTHIAPSSSNCAKEHFLVQVLIRVKMLVFGTVSVIGTLQL